MWKPVLAGLGAVLLFGGPAAAQISATATTELNIRSGPGPEYPVIGVIDGSAGVPINGCVEGGGWCSVTYNGVRGWAYSDYLVADYGGSQVVLAEPPPELGVPIVTYEGPSAALPGAAAGAAAGAIVGGPVGAVVGGAAGAVAGAAVDPPTKIQTYVVDNPVEPVYLQGEVVVGATLPQSVQVVPIPQYQYSYVYVNGVPVLVEPQSHQIVHVFRQ